MSIKIKLLQPMKTNVNMIRKMGDFEVIQRTQDGMFNASWLLNQWNNNLENPQRSLKDFWKLQSVNEFMNVLIEEENLHGVNLPYVKSKASRGNNAGTWMHPILFIKFAMWLNPRFEYFVIKFVHDQLIEFRHLAGDNFKRLSSAVKTITDNSPDNYKKVAKMLNYIVFNKHTHGIRQYASSQQLRELSELQEKAAFLIEMEYVNSMEELRDALRKIYQSKYSNLILK